LKRIRILLLEMAPMLLDIVANIVADQPDMDIVPGPIGETNLRTAVERGNADVVILSRKTPLDGAYDDLLYSRAHLKVIEIESEGRRGSLYELRPHRVPLGEMSPTGLLDAIRESPRRYA
jgi:chemotaxis response regulator CheB